SRRSPRRPRSNRATNRGVAHESRRFGAAPRYAGRRRNMANPAKRKGTAFESAVRDYLNSEGIPARRVAQAGRYDEGDLHGVDPFILERSEEHMTELQSRENLVCRLLLEKN